jgi:hypothetical protein
MRTLGRTWELAKQSFAVLRADKEILLFPVLSAIAAVLVSATFVVPLWFSGAFAQAEEGGLPPLAYLTLFANYYALYFVIIFFNSALVACANIRLGGGDPTVGDGLRMASSRIGRIAVWALVASTVGLLLRMLEERAEYIARIVISLVGLAWTLLTYFIVPVIIFEDRTMGESIKRSAELFRRNWGEQVLGGFSFGLLGFLLAIPAMVLTVALAVVHPLLGILFFLLSILTLAAVLSALRGIFTVALYRYATQGEVPAGFSPELIRGAFTPRG